MRQVGTTLRFLVLAGVTVAALVPSASAQGGCDRACLTGFLDGWFKGLANDSITGVPVAKD